MKQVLYIANSANIGGGNISLLLLCEGIKEYGLSPVVMAFENGMLLEILKKKKIRSVTFPNATVSLSNPIATIKTQFKLIRILRRLKPILIHTNDLSTSRLISITSKIFNIPVVSHIRYPFQKGYFEWAFRRLMPPDAVIYNSHAMKRELCEEIVEFAPKTKHFVIHNAVNVNEFVPKQRPVTEKVIVGMIANFVKVKGHIDFLEMAKIVNEKYSSTEFWLAGEDYSGRGYKDLLKETVKKNGSAKSVIFKGYVEKVNEFLQKVDILVCPSLVEPFGRCLIEAMACGVPTVGTRAGGIPEIIRDGETGYLVEPSSPEILADRVLRLINKPSLRRDMGNKGREIAEKYFSQENHLSQIFCVYDVLSKQRSNRLIR